MTTSPTGRRKGKRQLKKNEWGTAQRLARNVNGVARFPPASSRLCTAQHFSCRARAGKRFSVWCRAARNRQTAYITFGSDLR